MPALYPRNRPYSAFAALPGWFENPVQRVAAAPSPDAGDMETPAPPPYLYDASLLFRCMDALQIDRSELAAEDPLLFRELQGRCALCRNKESCIQDLGAGLNDAAWDRWRDYCADAMVLMQLGAVQNCGWAAQHLRRPRSADVPKS